MHGGASFGKSQTLPDVLYAMFLIKQVGGASDVR